jgi:hypothetical protein
MGSKCGVIGNTLGTKKTKNKILLPNPTKLKRKKIEPSSWPWHMHMSAPFCPQNIRKQKKSNKN